MGLPMMQDTDMGVDLANIPLDRDHYIPNSAASGVAPEKASAILAQMSRRRKAAAIAVPTDDGRVRQQLRNMGEPITLFGEGLGDRRDRLRELLTRRAELDAGSDGGEDDTRMLDAVQQGGDDTGEQEEEFYTEGTPELLAARQAIARYSLPRAQSRIASQKLEAQIPLRTHVKHRKALKARLTTFDLVGTQIAGERPVSLVRFSPNGDTIASGNWAGGVKLLSVPTLDEVHTLRGHTDRIGGIDWFPSPPTSSPSSSSPPREPVSLATGGGEGAIHLWSLTQDTPLATLTGHTARVCRIAFHPSGAYLASASFDTTWRLWDVTRATELQLQEGHSREVYAVSFNTDGSLLATAGLDSLGRIWDVRTGRTVMILDGHSRDVYALDWSHDGHRVLSGSGDGFVKCWDMRNVAQAASLGANKGGVTDLRWFKARDALSAPTMDERAGGGGGGFQPKESGGFFASGGFDRNVQLFSADDWALARTLSGHSGNVLGVDVDVSGRYVVSCGHDRTVKLWGGGDEGGGAGEENGGGGGEGRR